jgi:hypothetical protein
MPAIPAIAIAIGAIGGAFAIGEGINALTHSPKNPSDTAPTLPTEISASNTAQQAQTQQRQAALAAGGNTNVTGGSGIILGQDVNSVTLVGSA